MPARKMGTEHVGPADLVNSAADHVVSDKEIDAMRPEAFVLFIAIAAVVSAGESKQPERPKSAVIVLEGTHSRQGIAQTRAISVLNRQTIEKLEAFFPNYRKVPSSDLAGGWERGYTVYFNFPKGRTLRVAVSWGSGDTWTMAGGDLETNGDFGAFVKFLSGPKKRR